MGYCYFEEILENLLLVAGTIYLFFLTILAIHFLIPSYPSLNSRIYLDYLFYQDVGISNTTLSLEQSPKWQDYVFWSVVFSVPQFYKAMFPKIYENMDVRKKLELSCYCYSSCYRAWFN